MFTAILLLVDEAVTQTLEGSDKRSYVLGPIE